MFRVSAAIWFTILFLSLIGACSASGAGITAPDTAFGNTHNDELTDSYRDAAGIDDPDIIIKAANNTIKIRRDTEISTLKNRMVIRAARNEHEAFQVVAAPAGGMYLDDVQIGVSDLYGPNEELFSRDNFSYYLEGFVYCSDPSDSGGGTGWFADPLIPISNSFDVDMTVGLQPVWIDCYIPSGTTPGVYTGNVVITAAGGLMESIQIRLKVIDLTLGEGFRLKTAFGLNREVINDYHGYSPGENRPEIDQLRTKYMDLLLDNGVSSWGLDWFKPSYVVNMDDTVTVDFSAIASRIDDYLLGGKYEMSAFMFPLRLWDLINSRMAADTTIGSSVWCTRVKSYIRECSEYFETRGVLDKTYMYIIDEPASAGSYQNIRYLGKMLQDVEPRPKFLVTEQPYSSNLMEWGSLLGYVDIFCPIIHLYEPDGNVDPDDPYYEGIFDYESWIYTNTNVHPFPGYAIDHSSLEPRLLSLMCYQQGIKGVLYWSANYWKMANPWDNPYTLGDSIYGAGNGSLIYPGMYISEYTNQDDVDGPISSIRLEQIREGLEDYEYLMEIANGDPIPELDVVIPAMEDYIVDGNLYYRLRSIATEYFFGGD